MTMCRVLVMGPSGSGKSTVARQVGEALGLPITHLDALFWRPGWVESPLDEFAAAVGRALQRDSWVIDGNYGAARQEERLARADTIIYLDFPRRVCLWRVFRRRWRYRGRTRPDIAEGCPEKVDLDFLRWVWTAPRRRAGQLDRIARYATNANVIMLCNAAHVDRYLTRLRSMPASEPVEPALP